MTAPTTPVEDSQPPVPPGPATGRMPPGRAGSGSNLVDLMMQAAVDAGLMAMSARPQSEAPPPPLSLEGVPPLPLEEDADDADLDLPPAYTPAPAPVPVRQYILRCRRCENLFLKLIKPGRRIPGRLTCPDCRVQRRQDRQERRAREQAFVRLRDHHCPPDYGA